MYMYYLLGFKLMDQPISVDRKEVIAENTFLLTLDGDIDFTPSAVALLIDLMKKNTNLGAACGRIHPVGSGKVVIICIMRRLIQSNISWGSLAFSILQIWKDFSAIYMRMCS